MKEKSKKEKRKKRQVVWLPVDVNMRASASLQARLNRTATSRDGKELATVFPNNKPETDNFPKRFIMREHISRVRGCLLLLFRLAMSSYLTLPTILATLFIEDVCTVPWGSVQGVCTRSRRLTLSNPPALGIRPSGLHTNYLPFTATTRSSDFILHWRTRVPLSLRTGILNIKYISVILCCG